MTRKSVFVCLAALGVSLLPAAPAVPIKTKASAPPVKLHRVDVQTPLRFEPNVGQAEPGVRFIARGGQYTMLLTGSEVVMALQSSVVKMNLLRAETGLTGHAENRLESITNYYLGDDPAKWHPAVPNFGRVKFDHVYPGIDVVYYGNERRLEYDFVVQPGADPSQIRLSYSGADSMRVNQNGDLILAVAGREIVQQKPIIYQNVKGRRVEIAGHYQLFEQTYEVRFALARYDRSQPLVIDPTIVYSTYLGGTGLDKAAAVAVQGSMTYVTGNAQAGFPLLNQIQAFGGTSDVFVSQFRSDGVLVYSTFLGGPGTDSGLAIAVQATGEVYVSGTAADGFPLLGAAQGTYGGGATDAFAVKLNLSGALVYSTYLGGSGDDRANGIATDSSGAAYVTGAAASASFPVLNASQGAFGGGTSDAFVTKLSSSGSMVYSTFLGGSTADAGRGIAVDASGASYVSGLTDGGTFPLLNAAQDTYGGGTDAFVTKLNAAGAILYSTYLGGPLFDGAYGLAIDSQGSAYVTGAANTGFPVLNAAQSTFSGGPSDAFLTKLGPIGQIVYSTYIGGTGDDRAGGIALDSTGAAYISGSSNGNLPVLNAVQGTRGGAQDLFVFKFSPAGIVSYGTYLGGIDFDLSGGVAVDATGAAYVVGFSFGSFPVVNAAQGTYAGGQDAVIVKISADAPISTARITNIAPDNVLAGSAAYTLEVAGTGFATGAVVSWNGTALTSTSASSSSTAKSLRATVPTSLITAAGVAAITITNPGETPSNAAIVTINSAPIKPTITSTRPSWGYFPSTGIIANRYVQIFGSGFQPSATVTWNGIVLPTIQYADLTATTPGVTVTPLLSFMQTPGPVTLTVTNPGGAPSNSIVLTIPTLPTITSVTPNTVTAGAAYSLLLSGNGFTSTDFVYVIPTATGTFPSTSFVNSTQLRVTGTAPAAGVSQVWVNSTGTGGGYASNQIPLNVTNTATCVYSIDAASTSLPASATASATINVTATAGCGWTASSPVNWITITSAAAGTGNGPVTFSVQANTTAFSRTATLTIAGQTFTVQQAGVTCSYTLGQASQSFLSGAGSGSFSLTAAAGCAWAASSSVAWASLTSALTGSGSTTVAFNVAANTGATARAGNINIGGQSFAISQAGVPAAATCVASTSTPPILASEGVTETIGVLTLTCSGLTSAASSNIQLGLNTNVTNIPTPDAVLTVNGLPIGSPMVNNPNSLLWSNVTLGPGPTTILIRDVRVNASSLTTGQVVGTVTLSGATTIPVANPTLIVGNIQPGLLFQKGAPNPASGGAQTIIPLLFREGSATTFKPAQSGVGGTRLRLAISAIPATVQAYVTVFPKQGAGRAQLYSANATGLGGTPSPGAALAGDTYQQLTVASGAATATWEILLADQAQIETLNFSLLLQNATLADLAAIGVSAGLAPVDGTSIASATAPVPRFIGTSAVQKLASLRLNLSIPSGIATASLKAANTRAAAYVPGSNVSFALTLTNETTESTEAANNVVIQHNLPPGLTVVSAASAGTASYVVGGSNVSFAFTLINAGQTQTASIVAKIDAGLADGTVLDNWATASSNEINNDPAARIAKLGIVVVRGAPVSPSPADGAAAVSAPVLTWTPVAGATSYDVYLDTSAPPSFVASVTSPTYTPVGLPANLKYYWQVVAKTATGARSSEIWSFTTAPPAATLINPVPGITLPGTSATFTWTTATGVTAYWLDVGTAIGQGNLCASGQVTTVTYACANLPLNGAPVYVQLWSLTAAGWGTPLRYSYTAATNSVSSITAPVPGTQLPPNATFSWAAAAGAQNYWVDIGTTLGQGNLCASGILPPSTTSFTCNNLPSSATSVYVQLWTRLAGVWISPQQYLYTPPSGTASIFSPTPGTQLQAVQIFTWTPTGLADAYWLDVGTNPGQGNLCASGVLTAATSNFTCSGIPPTGAATIYVQLFTRVGGVWSSPRQYTYLPPANVVVPVAATLTSPAPLSVLPGPTVTFNWTAGAALDYYWLDVGTAAGIGNLSSGIVNATSKTVTGLPTNGSPLFVRLWSHLANGSGWITPPIDYVFTANGGDPRATLLVPGAGTLVGSTITFGWKPGSGADGYWLDVGPTVGSGAYSSGLQTSLARTVTGLPCNSQPIYARLWTRVAGVFQSPIDYAFATQASCLNPDNRARLTAPALGTQVSGTSATFTWNAAPGAGQYWLDVGNALGSGNISAGPTAALSQSINTLPNDGKPLYVRLWTNIGGTWQSPIDYVF